MISPLTASSRPLGTVLHPPGASAPTSLQAQHSAPGPALDTSDLEGASLREAFDSFVGQTFYGAMLKSMRHSLGKPAYFHGGRGEEVFQGQLDQTLVEEMAKSSAGQLTGPMFELFTLSRR